MFEFCLIVVSTGVVCWIVKCFFVVEFDFNVVLYDIVLAGSHNDWLVRVILR